MKKILLFLFVFCIAFSSCGKKEEVKKEEKKPFSNLTYVPGSYDSDVHLVKDVIIKNTDSAAYSLYADYKKSKIEKETDKIKGFPIEVEKYDANDGIKLKMVLPNEIYIEISNVSPKDAERYRSLELMKEMILLFDLDGLAKITGDNLPGGGKDLEKFFPKL